MLQEFVEHQAARARATLTDADDVRAVGDDEDDGGRMLDHARKCEGFCG